MIKLDMVAAWCAVGLLSWAVVAHAQDVDAGTVAAETSPPTAPALVADAPVEVVAPPPSAEVVPPVPPVVAPLLPELFVTLNDAPVFSLRLGRGRETVEHRVKATTRALALAVKDPTEQRVRSVAHAGVVTLYVGDAPIVQLTPADAEAAEDTSLEVHAATVMASVREAVEREQRRREIAHTAFSVSLVVFFGLIMVYLLRRFHEISDRGVTYLSSPQHTLTSVRMSAVEVVAPGTLRSMLLVGLSVARWVGSVGVVYAWLMVVLSLFEPTRIYTEKLAGFVLNPLGELMGRLAASLPTFVVALVAALALALFVRFVDLYFASVARGEATLSWVPPELAMAFSVPLRVTIVVSALVFAAPIVTGDRLGSLTLLGGLLLVTVALASVPLLANAVIGLVILWRRRVRVGERAELGGCRGRVLGMDLWSVRMEDASGAELHIPHWLVLTKPMRVFPLMRRVTLGLEISDTTPVTKVLSCLQHAVGDGFDQVTVTVTAVGEGRVTYHLAARSSMPNSESVLLTRVRVAAETDEIVIVRGSVVDDHS